jgi:hypothetical protein
MTISVIGVPCSTVSYLLSKQRTYSMYVLDVLRSTVLFVRSIVGAQLTPTHL